MSKESFNFLDLLKEKKYSEILSIIENGIDKEKLTSGLLNLSGVCRLMLSQSDDSVKLAIDDFRGSILKETEKNKLVDPIKNLINAKVIFFDNQFYKNENFVDSNFFDEIDSIYKKNEELFNESFELTKQMVKIYKRTSNVKKFVNSLKKIIKVDSSENAVASYIYFNNYLYDWSQKDYLENAKKINHKLHKYPSNELLGLKEKKNKKINLGFISSDLKSKHSVTYFLRSVLTNYNKNKFDIYLYHNHNKKNEITKELEKYVFKTSHISDLKDNEAINLIRKDEIDIIIDLNGFSGDHRMTLFKNRLAKNQISWCGYTNTTGLEEMDYLIVDKNLIKPEEEIFYSEKVIYLQNIWNCHSGYDFERSENKMPCEKNKFITFGSFNNFLKINDDVIEVWSSILKKVKNSKLILKSSSAISQELHKRKFEKFGVLSSIIFLNYSKDFQGHLDKYKQIDIALDTFPWNGVTTSFEAAWMNVPVIVMDGFNYNSRCGSSINKNLDLTNLIAKDKEDYINIAVNLSQDKDQLLNIRKNLFENVINTPLFDKKNFSDQFFASLEKINN